MASIFISYRRQDSQWAARSLCDRLRVQFGGRVFMDIDTIEPGDDFVEIIEAAVTQCSALIALIGAQWLDVRDESGARRLDNDADFIRLEIATALKRGIRVIPVLVGDVSMPREDQLPADLKRLARKQAIEIRPKSLENDTKELITFLQEKAFKGRQEGCAAPEEIEPSEKTSPTVPIVPGERREEGGPTNSVESAAPQIPRAETSTRSPQPPPVQEASRSVAADGTKRLAATDFGVHVDAIFDHPAYDSNTDPLAHFLVELQINPPVREVLKEVPNSIVLLLDVSGSMRKEHRFELLCDAVREFLQRLPRKDRAAIVLFSDESRTASDFVRGTDSSRQVDSILQSIKDSPVLFGGKTNLLPALEQTLALFERETADPEAVKRVYILTDGGFHDARAAMQLLPRFRESRFEIGIYGFGTHLDVGKLQVVLRGQYGGWVKPIVNKPDIIKTFGHVAEVSRTLVAQEARFFIAFDERVTAGDVWSFRPHARYIGQVNNRRFSCDTGPVEAGRVYSLMMEVRLPPDEKATSPVALVRVLWRHGTEVFEHRVIARATRTNDEPPLELALDPYSVERIEEMNSARQAYLMLDALRKKEDLHTQLISRRAERVIAAREGRTDKFGALEKEIKRLEAQVLGVRDDELVLGNEEQWLLSAEEEMLLDADEASNICLLDSDLDLEAHADPRVEDDELIAGDETEPLE